MAKAAGAGSMSPSLPLQQPEEATASVEDESLDEGDLVSRCWSLGTFLQRDSHPACRPALGWPLSVPRYCTLPCYAPERDFGTLYFSLAVPSVFEASHTPLALSMPPRFSQPTRTTIWTPIAAHRSWPGEFMPPFWAWPFPLVV